MNQDELIAKLTPAIGLRKWIDPHILTISPRYADPIITIRQLRPAERTFTDETLDTILVERETDPWHDQPYGLVAASTHAIAMTWFPGPDPTTIRLRAEGLSATTGKPTTYVQIFSGSAEQICIAIATAKAAAAWADDLNST